MELSFKQQSELIRKIPTLLQQTFSAPVETLETHISVIFLVGDKAFKLKKAVNFGFLDFSTLDKRRHFCEEEIRLNGRLAPDIYEKVVCIGGDIKHPEFDESHHPIDYMVQMKRFDQSHLMDNLLLQQQLDMVHMEALAKSLAEFHQQIEIANEKYSHDNPDSTLAAVQENFDQIRPLLENIHEAETGLFNELETWSQSQSQQLYQLMQARLAQGYVRECHGDMHLGNIALINNHVTIFDGIEFNESFRWIDVISELAFLLMDLYHRNRPDFAARVLNSYFEETGDYVGMQLLPYYLVYRAMVRTKVDALRLSQLGNQTSEYENLRRDFNSHLKLAHSFCIKQSQFLAVTHGYSGSGKSFVTRQLCDAGNVVRVRSDVERLRLFPDEQERYSKAATDKIYSQLITFARLILQSGFDVVLDATYLKYRHRKQVAELAYALDKDFYILEMSSPVNILEERIRQRFTQDDASEATVDVLHKQIDSAEPLATEEIKQVIRFDQDTDIAETISNFLQSMKT